jgi:hypothetical protein
MTSALKTAILAGIVVAGSLSAISARADDYDYFDRRDTISSSAGNAQASNLATQTIDPWPPYVRDTQNHLDGRRAAVGIQRYQANKSIQPRGLNTTTISEQAGPGAQSSAQIQK